MSRVVLITGAASGIGKALAKQFRAAGDRVVLVDIDKVALDETAAELESPAFVVDVSLEDQVAALKRAAGRVDVLINCAGVGVAGLLWETPKAVWDWTMGVNLEGVINCIRVFVPDMVERNSGYVVNIASAAGLLAPAGMGAYNASKHAVVGLTETLLHDFALKGADVGVSVVCPGMVDTNITDSFRTWPERLGSNPADEEDRAAQAIRKRHRRALSKSLSADAAAQMIIDGIKKRQFWIFTDDEYAEAITARFEKAVKGERPLAPKYV